MTFKRSLSIIMSALIAAATSGVFNVAAPQSITAVAVDTAEASDNFNGLIFHEREEIYDYPLYFEKAVNLQKNGTYSDRENGFFLCDINADGIPELFVTYDTEDESIYFAGSIYNEELQVIYNNTGIGAWGGGSSLILYTNGCFGTSSRDNSTFYNTIYKYDDKGKRTTISSVSVDLASNEYNKYIDDKSYSITESEYNSILNQYKIASYTTASVSDYLSAAENTKTFDSWQEGYKEELSRIDSPNSYTYGIMDINADGIPELIVQSSSAVMPSYLYTFYRNKVIRLMGLEKGGSVSYCKSDNTCLTKCGSAGYVYYRTFKIQNGYAQKIDDVFWDTGNTYTLNDKSITQSQYQTWQSNNITSKAWTEFDCISFNEMNSKLAAMMPVTTTTTKPTTTTTTTTRTTTKTSPVTTTTTTPYNELKLSTDKITLKAGEQYTISANQTNLTYSSNNKSVAIVSSSGIITALSDGEAIISVYNSNYDVAQIRVTVDSSSITLPVSTTTTTTTTKPTTTTTTTTTTTSTTSTTTRTTTTATTTTTTTTTTATTTKIVDSGTCGDNLTWALNNEGTLTISGTGKMDDFFEDNQVPWYSSRYAIKNVTIENGVTSIGNFAFYYCKNLKSIKIPDSVTSIEDSAFYYCTSLKSIALPDSVTSIGVWAFRDCKSLTSITIPNSVTSIGALAFNNTPWLENKQKENPIVVVNGILIDGTTCEDDVIIPNSVTSIADDAYCKCSGLTSITLPDSVTSIGNSAFGRCTNLESIMIPNSVSSIADTAFIRCSSNLTIKGYKDSYAEKYAKEHNIKFEIYDESAATTTSETNVIGDTNLDGRVTVADAVAILQFISNKDKYDLNSQARKNADCFNVGDGITGSDALAIQRLDAKVIAKLPYNE